MSGLSVAGAVVRYEDLVAVDGVDLAVAPGEIVALLGASGSGKSSLLRGIAGLEPLAAGRVCWDDVDLATVPVHKRGFGMLFQDGQLFNHLSVEGNVGYGLFRDSPAVRRERVNGLLELVGLGGYGKRRVSELSGGQAQRVALA
ncbi:MAG TPA: ATP-binding cassette domain-containing protein, partial [Micropruina sp.]|nr:ATP-binding cassette domain-containing protein [Micropruina sp.]